MVETEEAAEAGAPFDGLSFDVVIRGQHRRATNLCSSFIALASIATRNCTVAGNVAAHFAA